VVVLRTDGHLRSRISVFADPRLAASFGFPPNLVSAGQPTAHPIGAIRPTSKGDQ
jgi:hypothetical protein